MLAGLLLAGGALLLTLRSEPPPGNPQQLCSVFREKPGWYRDSTRAAARWGASLPALMAVMMQESSFEARARPERERLLGFIPWARPSTAFGYAQVVDGTWQQYERATGVARSRYDFAHAVDFVAWYLTELGQVLGLASRDIERLYLAYHEGPAGYRRGSFREKPWLEKVAARVSERARDYRSQLEGCRAGLDRDLWWRAFRTGAFSVAGLTAGLGLLGWWIFRPRRRRKRKAR